MAGEQAGWLANTQAGLIGEHAVLPGRVAGEHAVLPGRVAGEHAVLPGRMAGEHAVRITRQGGWRTRSITRHGGGQTCRQGGSASPKNCSNNTPCQRAGFGISERRSTVQQVNNHLSGALSPLAGSQGRIYKDSYEPVFF